MADIIPEGQILSQRQRRLITYHENPKAQVVFEEIYKKIRSYVFESYEFELNFFGSLSDKSLHQPELFEYAGTQREWDFLQRDLEFIKILVDSKLASVIFFYISKAKQTTVRSIATKTGKFDNRVRYWTNRFVQNQLLKFGVSQNGKIVPLMLNPDFKMINTIILDLIEEKYSRLDLEKSVNINGVSKSKVSNKKFDKVYRMKIRKSKNVFSTIDY